MPDCRYIDDPLLIGGKKFHVRTYVLCIGSLRCFVYDEMLALFAGDLYNEGEIFLKCERDED